MTVAVTEINEQMLQKKKENTNENKTSIPVVAQCSRCVPDSNMCVHVQSATSGPTDTCALCLYYVPLHRERAIDSRFCAHIV